MWWWEHASHQVGYRLARQSVGRRVGSTLQQMFCLAAGSDQATWRVNGAVKLTDNWSNAYGLRMPRINHLLSGRTVRTSVCACVATRHQTTDSLLQRVCGAYLSEIAVERRCVGTSTHLFALRCRWRGNVQTSLCLYLCVCVRGCSCDGTPMTTLILTLCAAWFECALPLTPVRVRLVEWQGGLSEFNLIISLCFLLYYYS